MKTIATILLIALLASCSNNNNEGQSENNSITTGESSKKNKNKGTIYLRTYYSAFGGGSLDISWIYLGDDGSIVQDPVHGLNPVDVEAEKKDNEHNTGTYTTEGDKFIITWANDKTSEWEFGKENGEITSINAGIVSVPDAFKKGETIEGKFTAAALGGEFSRVQTFQFNKDGSFDINTSTGMVNKHMSSHGEKNTKGTYELEGNTLRLRFNDGKQQVANIAHWKENDGSMMLVINGSSFPQEK